MITDRQTDMVYFSGRITWRKVWPQLKDLLEANGVRYGLLGGTRDIWARDFMPIQVAPDRFVAYSYDPDYGRDADSRKRITDLAGVTGYEISGRMEHTDLIIDGGNVIRCDEHVLMTDKVLMENWFRRGIPQHETLKEIERLFEAEPVILPWNFTDEWDFCGHADGMVRYLGNGRVLVNDMGDHSETLWQRDRVVDILERRGFSTFELSYGPGYHGVNSWAYLNYLQVGTKVFMPTVEREEDDRTAESLLKKAFGEGFDIIPVPLLPIVKANGKNYGGGALNCISWNIMK